MSSSQESHTTSPSSEDQPSKDANLLSIIVRCEKQSQKQEKEEAQRQRREERKQQRREEEKKERQEEQSEIAELEAMYLKLKEEFSEEEDQEELAELEALFLKYKKELEEEEAERQRKKEAKRVLKKEAKRHVEELEREIEEIWSTGGWPSCAFPESYQVASVSRWSSGSKLSNVKIDDGDTCCQTSSHLLCRQSSRSSVSTTTSTTTIKATSRGLFRSTSNGLFVSGSSSAPPRAWIGVELRVRQLRCLWRDRRIG